MFAPVDKQILPQQDIGKLRLGDALRRGAVPVFLYPFGVIVLVYRQDDLRLVLDAPGNYSGIRAVPGADLLIDFSTSAAFSLSKRPSQSTAIFS